MPASLKSNFDDVKFNNQKRDSGYHTNLTMLSLLSHKRFYRIILIKFYFL